jgi:PST family polysaccharide transporter
LVTGFQSQHIAFLNRHLRFQSLALIEVATITANAVVSVLLAWLTESYWALFAGSAASTFVRVFAAWISSGWKPGWPSFEGQFREIFLFGSGISGFNIVNYFARNADNLLIGRFYGSEQLGYYDRAYKLLLLPIQQVQSPLSRVMLPLLSRLNDQPDRYRTAYTECISLILLVTHPGLLFAAIFAKPIFLFLFGPHWLPAAPIFTWLGAAGLSHCINSPTGWLFLSQGRSGEYFKLGLYNAITVLLSFAIGLPWGPVGVAAVYAISEYACRVPLVSAMAGRSGPVTTRNIYQTVIPHWIAILLTGGILLVIYGTVQEITVLHCAFLFILAYLIYFVTILFFPSKRVILSKGMNTLLSDLILKRKAA